MAMLRANFGDILTPGQHDIFVNTLKKKEELFSQLFNILSSDKRREIDSSISGFGLIPAGNEGADATLDVAYQEYDTTYTMDLFKLYYSVSRELYDDDLYGVINKLPEALALSAWQTVETDAWNVLNRAFNTSYTGGDGSVLCATNHARVGGGVWSNRPSTDADLAVASLKSAIQSFADLTDGRGLKMPMTPKILVVSTTDMFLADELLGSTNQPFTADNQINVFKNKYQFKVIISPWISDADSWWLFADKGEHKLNFFWRRKFDFGRSQDFLSDNALFKLTFRKKEGWSDARGAYGTSGA